MDNPLITVIIPIYNVEKYLSRCLESVINQTYSNIEIILINDGSTDSSWKIIDEYSKKDNRIKSFYRKNEGLSATRNFGIEKATGKYICFFDSDDYVNIKIIEELYKLIKEKNYKMSVIGYEKIFNSSELNKKELESEEIIKYNKEEAINNLFIKDGFGNYACNKMYDISLFKDIQYPVNRFMEDLGTTYKLILQCDEIPFSLKKYYYYYQREDSIMHVENTKLIIDKLEQSIARYYDIKEVFPSNYYNKWFIFYTILGSIPYLEKNKELENECERIIKEEIPNEVKIKANLTVKVCYIIYKLNKRVYIKLFKSIKRLRNRKRTKAN